MATNNPLVSVIVPCYNHERYIQECILSVVNQTYENIELMIIDDGSRDNSVKIIKELSDKYNFYFESQLNMGLTATLNKTIPMTNGKYICFLASDDYWELTKIEKQVSQMEKDKSIGLSYGRTQAIDENNNFIDGPKIFKGYKGYVFKRLLFSNFIPAPTVLIRKEVLTTVGGYDPNIKIEDWYMWLKIANIYKIDYIDDIVAYYRQHDSNFSKNYFTMLKYDIQIINLWKRYVPYYILAFLNSFRRYFKNRFLN